MDEKNRSLFRVKCPFCGYTMPIWYSPEANASGVFVKCKGRNCKKQFEIKISKAK